MIPYKDFCSGIIRLAILVDSLGHLIRPDAIRYANAYGNCVVSTICHFVSLIQMSNAKLSVLCLRGGKKMCDKPWVFHNAQCIGVLSLLLLSDNTLPAENTQKTIRH